MATSWLIIPFYLAVQYFNFTPLSIITAINAISAAASQGYRLALFYRPGVAQEPMLWSLYLAFAWLITGYVLIALDLLLSIKEGGIGAPLPWLHAITIGGLLSMIISMMARISLGHTGRKIITLPFMAFCFVLLNVATLIRILGTSIAGISVVGSSLTLGVLYVFAILCIILALGIFLFHYGKILWLPRADD
jgi:uncharacterized protein involved in response to NO